MNRSDELSDQTTLPSICGAAALAALCVSLSRGARQAPSRSRRPRPRRHARPGGRRAARHLDDARRFHPDRPQRPARQRRAHAQAARAHPLPVRKGRADADRSDGKRADHDRLRGRQVQRWPISNSPLGALLDPNRDVKRATARLKPTGNPDVISVEVRDRASRIRRHHADLHAQAFGARAGWNWRAGSRSIRRTSGRRFACRITSYGVAVPTAPFAGTIRAAEGFVDDAGNASNADRADDATNCDNSCPLVHLAASRKSYIGMVKTA
jgi:hypothetical protein